MAAGSVAVEAEDTVEGAAVATAAEGEEEREKEDGAMTAGRGRRAAASRGRAARRGRTRIAGVRRSERRKFFCVVLAHYVHIYLRIINRFHDIPMHDQHSTD